MRINRLQSASFFGAPPMFYFIGVAFGSHLSKTPVTAWQIDLGVFFLLIPGLVAAYTWLERFRSTRSGRSRWRGGRGSGTGGVATETPPLRR